MKKILCDRCDNDVENMVDNDAWDIDLCKSCQEKFGEWMKEGRNDIFGDQKWVTTQQYLQYADYQEPFFSGL